MNAVSTWIVPQTREDYFLALTKRAAPEVEASFVRFVFDAFGLTSSEPSTCLTFWAGRLTQLSLQLASGPVKRSLVAICSQVERLMPPEVSLDELTLRLHSFQIASDRARAWQAATNYRREAPEPDELDVKEGVWAVKARSHDDARREQLVEDLMHLSLSRHVVCSRWLPIHEDYRDLQFVASSYEQFLILGDLKKNVANRILSRLDGESQLALLQLLELQPLDHHNSNLGFRISRKDPLSRFRGIAFDDVRNNERYDGPEKLILAYDAGDIGDNTELCPTDTIFSQPLSVFKPKKIADTLWEVCFFDNEMSMYSGNDIALLNYKGVELHILPVRSEIFDKEWASLPLEEALLDKLQCPKREERMLSWMMHHPDRPACLALRERFERRRQFFGDCKDFTAARTDEERQALYKRLLNNKRSHIPASWRQKLLAAKSLDEMQEGLKQWMVPTYKNLAGAIYPLVPHVLKLGKLFASDYRRLVGSFQIPIEAVIYHYLKRQPRIGELWEQLSLAKAIFEGKSNEVDLAVQLHYLYYAMKERGNITEYCAEIELLLEAIQSWDAFYFADIDQGISDIDDL